MKNRVAAACVSVLVAAALTACGTTTGGGSATGQQSDIAVDTGVDLSGKRICFGFSGSETEFWAAGIKSIKDTIAKSKGTVIEHDSNEDVNKQLEQVRDCITQKVDGIIIIPQDGASANTIISEANKADIPIAVFNRPPASKDGAAIVAVADNRAVSKATMEYMTEQAKKLNKKVKPLIMVGDLGDQNAVERRNGFMDVINANPDLYDKPIEVQTKWDAATGKANLEAAMQANKDIDLLFTSSDFLYPQIKSVLEPMNKWKKSGEDGHVIMGGIDGDNRACNLLKDGYVDATGVQDLFREAEDALKALSQAIKDGKTQPDEWLVDPGFAITQANKGEMEPKTWGCVIQPPQ